ncbi:MAG: J domain-containing protein [Rhodobacteraceae bacterium]|nr:J domain-containing protein [Paracoccaceae bacterium]
MQDSLYKTLGVSKTATQSDIKKAYRKLMKELHPDLNPGDSKAETRFKKVTAANDIIGDEEKRKRYDAGEIDATGNETPQQQYYRQYADGRGQNPYQGQAGYQDAGDMGDIFSQMFNRRQGGAQQAFKGQDRRYNMSVAFMDAALGGKKQVTMADGASLNISIPKGIESGKTIRLKGKGEPGHNGGPAGDALIQVEVENHPVFTRNGLDIEVTLPLTLYEAALGGKVSVPTIKGNVGLNIPAGSSTGKVLRLKGRGIETARKKGDQLVKISIQMPENIDADLKAFMESWQKDHPYDPRKSMKGAAHV